MYTFTNQDYAVIDTLRTSYLPYYVREYRFTPTKLGYFLDDWKTNKGKYLFRLFGDNLILRKKITYQKDNQVIEDDLKQVLENDVMIHFYNKLDWAYYRMPSSSRRDAYFYGDSSISSLFTTACLLSNCYTGPTIKMPIDDTHTLTLTNGARPCRILGKLANILGMDQEWETVRIKISQILNQRTLEGDLCLSIHPADYLTASLNTCGWESCMNIDGGCYRSGILEMMNSPCVVVAYLTAKDDMPLGDSDNICYWNNKKWREFFIVDPDVISGIKGYPYWNRTFEDTVIDWIKELVKENNIFPSNDFAPIEEVDFNYRHGTKIAFDCGPSMYNDFYHIHHMSFNDKFFVSKMPWRKLTIDYSQPATCINCGCNHINEDNDDYSRDAEYLCCRRCQPDY